MYTQVSPQDTPIWIPKGVKRHADKTTNLTKQDRRLKFSLDKFGSSAYHTTLWLKSLIKWCSQRFLLSHSRSKYFNYRPGLCRYAVHPAGCRARARAHTRSHTHIRTGPLLVYPPGKNQNRYAVLSPYANGNTTHNFRGRSQSSEIVFVDLNDFTAAGVHVVDLAVTSRQQVRDDSIYYSYLIIPIRTWVFLQQRMINYFQFFSLREKLN